jgi:hypothetical protein
VPAIAAGEISFCPRHSRENPKPLAATTDDSMSTQWLPHWS